MERDLDARDRVGVQDFVLLENYTSEDAFIDNLHKRYNENLVYVSFFPSTCSFIIYTTITMPLEIRILRIDSD